MRLHGSAFAPLAPVAGLAATLVLTLSGAAYAQGHPSPASSTAAVPPAVLAMPARGGAVTLKVDDYSAARRRVLDAARAQGAEVVDARTDVTEKGRRHGWLRLRLGSDRLPALLGEVRQVGKLYAEKVGTAELVSEYEDLEQRVVRLREHQGRLDALLKSPRRLRGSDILYVQERLFRAGVDEGMLRLRRAEIERRTRTSTVIVTLFEPLPTRTLDRARLDLTNAYVSARNGAGHRLNRLLARGATALAYAAVFAPLWLPLLAVALLLLRPAWKRRHALRVSLATGLRAARERLRERLAAPALPPATSAASPKDSSGAAGPV